MGLNGNHWQLHAELFGHHKAMVRVPRGEWGLAGLDHLADFDLKSGSGWASLPLFYFVPICLCVKLRGPEN